MRLKKRVLCFGKDPSLLNTRQWLLDLRFYTSTVQSLAELEKLANAHSFDLLVFCHTLSTGECQKGSEFARQHWPQAKILGLTSLQATCEPPYVDATVAGLEGPLALLDRAAELIQVASPTTEEHYARLAVNP